MNTKQKKIQVTDALRKGLYALFLYGNYEEKFDIADRVLADYPNADRAETIEAIEDALEFIRQIAISGGSEPFKEELK